MKTYTATIIFYAWAETLADTKKIQRIQRFARRENLRVIGDKLEHTLGQPLYLPDEDEDSGYTEYVDPSVEFRYFLCVASASPTKLHALISLLEAYASYCGINCRLFAMGEQ